MRKTMVLLVMLILFVFMATASAETPVRLMYDSLLDLLIALDPINFADYLGE